MRQQARDTRLTARNQPPHLLSRSLFTDSRASLIPCWKKGTLQATSSLDGEMNRASDAFRTRAPKPPVVVQSQIRKGGTTPKDCHRKARTTTGTSQHDAPTSSTRRRGRTSCTQFGPTTTPSQTNRLHRPEAAPVRRPRLHRSASVPSTPPRHRDAFRSTGGPRLPCSSAPDQ